MQYLGGKSRIARPIADLILAARDGRSAYVEPFVGGAAVFSRVAPAFARAVALDVVPDLIALWQAVADGWLPPDDVTPEEYAAARASAPSALRGYVGFGCSFGGKWFGGYATNDTRLNKQGIPYRGPRYAAAALRKQAPTVRGGEFRLGDYSDAPVTADAVVYCDPPYAGTTGYGAAGPFDSARFWRTAEAWAALGAAVLVSELDAPAGWAEVWRRPMPTYVRGGGYQVAAERVERLFADPATAARLAARAAA